MPDVIRSKSVKFFATAIVVCFIFLIGINVFHLYDETVFYTFQLRDIIRAETIQQGKLIFFGPEMTGGGNLPGPLYYVMMALSFAIKNHWSSAWIMQLTITFFGVLWCFHYFRQKYSAHMGIMWVVMFSMAPLTFWFLKVFLNVSSLLFFAIVSIMLIQKMVETIDHHKRKMCLYMTCLIIGLGLQFHLSIIFTFVALLMILLFQRQLKIPPIHLPEIMIGIILFIAPSLPYLIWLICKKMGFEFGEKSFYVGEGGDAISSLVFLIQEISKDSWMKIFENSTQRLFFTVPFALIPLIIALRSSAYLKTLFSRFRPMFICLFFAFIPYLNWYFSPQAIRYTMLFFVALNFFSIVCFYYLLQSQKAIQNFNIAAAIMLGGCAVIIYFYFSDVHIWQAFIGFCIMSFIALISLKLGQKDDMKLGLPLVTAHILLIALLSVQRIETQSADFKYKDRTHYMPTLKEWGHIWEKIYLATGWSYKEAGTKIYFVGHHMSQSPELAYNAMKKKNPQLINPIPDGFLVSNRYFIKSDSNSEAKLKRFHQYDGWLRRQNLPQEFMEALDNETIVLGKNLSEKILIVPYYVKDFNQFPQRFHNIGQGYQASAEDRLLQLIPESEGTLKLDDKNWLFKWNECPVYDDFCSTGALVSLGEKDIISVKVVGSALSQISPWISPNWTQAWIGPYMEIRCEGKTYSHQLMSSIGFNRELTHNARTPFFQGNNSFLAPFERKFSSECKGNIDQISIGRMGSKVDQVMQVINLPGKKLTINFF